jgi:hypothetical protein
MSSKIPSKVLWSVEPPEFAEIAAFFEEPNSFQDRRPLNTNDLRPAESLFLRAMQELGYGRFEYVRIERGEILLDPWPTTVRNVKFGTTDSTRAGCIPNEFRLKEQVAEFFEYARAVESGEIRTLEIRNGLPFTMEVEPAIDRRRGVHG